MPAMREKCAKVILFKAAEGKSDAYGDYLRETVEPIDHAAVKQGALLDMLTLVNESDASLPWTHVRIFFFASEAQRSAIKGAFARIAPQLQPDDRKRSMRRTYGESLRTLVSETDVALLG